MPNLTPPNFTLTVGSLDITSLVQQFSLRQNALDIRTPIYWEGTISIAKTKTWSGESLDDFENPCRWTRGRHPVSLTIDGKLFATLRISSYAYGEDTETAQIEVTQLLNLLNYRTPPEDYRFFETQCKAIAVDQAVESLLDAAGVTSYLINIPATFEIPAPDRTNRSYIELAQEMLGERGYWLYHAEDETVKVKSIDFNAAPSFSVARTDLVEFNRQPQRGDIVPTLYRVVGGGEKFADNCSLATVINETEEIFGTRPGELTYDFNPIKGLTNVQIGPSQRIVIEKTVTEVVVDTPSIIQVKKTGYKFLYFPTENRDGSLNFQNKTRRLVKIYEEIQSQYFDNKGRLIKEELSKDGTPVGNLGGDFLVFGLGRSREDFERPYRFTPLTRQSIEYSHNPVFFPDTQSLAIPSQLDENVLRAKITTIAEAVVVTSVAFLSEEQIGQSVNFPLQLTEKVVETWIEKCPNSEESSFIYRRKVYKRGKTGEIDPSLTGVDVNDLFFRSQLSKQDFDATPPSWTTRPPLCPRVESKLDVEFKKGYPCANNELIDSREGEFSASSITTETEARTLATILANFSLGRAFGYEAVMSLREASDYIDDPTPMQIAWLHNRALMLDSPSVVFDGREAEVAWEAMTLRALSIPVGTGTPIEVDVFPSALVFRLPTDIRLQFTARTFNLVDFPDLTLILIDANGDVVTSGGFIQASANQNQFAQILVDNNDRVVVDAESGNVVSSANDVYGNFWDNIATIDGEPISLDGEILWVA